MKDILIFMGQSASGKDTLVNELQDKFGWHMCTSYTTRPKRINEQEGVEYFFLDNNDEFNELFESGEMFEKTQYQTSDKLWLYGIGEKSIVNDNINMMILNPHGVSQILENDKLKDRVLIFYLNVDFETRFFRYLNRNVLDDKGKIEFIDRILRDDRDFMGITKQFSNIYELKSYDLKDNVNKVEMILKAKNDFYRWID